MYFSNKFILERELVTKIKNELVEIEGGFTFINPDGYYHFGGPDQMDGYVIRELEGWLKEYKEISEGDSHLMLNWLNELDVVNTQGGKTKYLCSIDTSLVFGRPDICFYFKK